MSKYPKEPCPVCGRDTTTWKVGFAQHMLGAHEIDPADPLYDEKVQKAKEAIAMTENSTEQTDTAPAVTPPAVAPEAPAPQPTPTPTEKPTPVKIKDPEARARYLQAIEIQEQRADAPEAHVADMTRDPLKSLVHRYAPECEGKNALWHAFFGRVGEEAADASVGYVSVFDEHGNHVRHKDVVLYKIPMAQYRAKVKHDGDESIKILSESLDDGQREAMADPKLAAAQDVEKSVRRGRLDE